MALRKEYYEGKDPQGIPGLENGTGRMRASREAEFRPLQESQWQIIDWQNCRRMPSPEWERKTARKERCKVKSVGTFGNTLPVGQKRRTHNSEKGRDEVNSLTRKIQGQSGAVGGSPLLCL